MKRYCSNCFQKTDFKLHEKNLINNNTYICSECGAEQVTCSVPGCDAMALATKKDKNGNMVKMTIADYFCAEHKGAIRNFETLNVQIKSLDKYEKVMEKRSWNWKGIAGTIGGATAVAAITFFTAGQAAPILAAKAGSLGILGAAGTGTAISTLSGAALTSASLAAIGGSVAGGIALITAVGAAFGAWKGGAIAQGYYSDIKPFKIRKMKNGDKSKPAIIFINGFMSSLEENREEWLEMIMKKYPDRIAYEIEWESKKLQDWFNIVMNPTAILKFIGKKGIKKGILALISGGTELADTPFLQAMYKAQATGVILADAIARTPLDNQYTIMGHSLGARVTYFTLLSLAQSEGNKNGLNRVHEVHFFGGAVATSEFEMKEVEKLNIQKINNYYSLNDQVLKNLYPLSTVFTSNPIGRNKIKGNKSVKNYDVTSNVSGHGEYVKTASRYLNVVDYEASKKKVV